MNYNTEEKEKKVFRIVMIIVWAVIAAILIMEACGVGRAQTWDECYEMTNKRIEWQQIQLTGGAED